MLSERERTSMSTKTFVRAAFFVLCLVCVVGAVAQVQWNSLIEEASQEEGQYVIQEHHWEDPYFDP
jgi:hypothetical protein